MARARRSTRIANGGVHHFALEQIEHHQLIELRDRDVARDARRTITLRVGEQIAKVDVGEPRSGQSDASIWKAEGGERGGHVGPKMSCGPVRVERGVSGPPDTHRKRDQAAVCC